MQNLNIVPLTIGGSWIYSTYTASAFQNLKAYPYKPNTTNDNKFKIWNVDELSKIDVNHITTSLLNSYQELRNKYNSIIIGPPNGGIVHLARLLKCLYLPSDIFLPIQINCNPDSIDCHALREGRKISRPLLEKEPNIEVVIHYDPIHDRVDIGKILHIRVKFLSLPDIYKEFIKKTIEENGTVINIQVNYQWPQYKIPGASRLFIQLGGYGEVSPDEYVYGSERVDKWLETQWTIHRGGWGPIIYPTRHRGHSGTVRPNYIMRPESEWGSLPELTEDVKEFCELERHNMINLNFDHPSQLGFLAHSLANSVNKREEKTSEKIVIETYWAMNPNLTLKTDYLPLWLPYVDITSHEICKKYLDHIFQNHSSHPIESIILGYMWAIPALDIKSPEDWVRMLSEYVPRENIQVPGVNSAHDPMSADIFKYIDTNIPSEQSTKFHKKATIEDIKKEYKNIKKYPI